MARRLGGVARGHRFCSQWQAKTDLGNDDGNDDDAMMMVVKQAENGEAVYDAKHHRDCENDYGSCDDGGDRGR